MYVNVGGNAGVSVPVSGGTKVEEKTLHEKVVYTDEAKLISGVEIVNFQQSTPGREMELRYLNLPEDLDNFCEQYALPRYSLPVVLPLKAHTAKMVPIEKIYYSSGIAWRAPT